MESLHERGLIHRDLKPGNFILVARSYSDVKVLSQTPTPRSQFVYRLVDNHNDKRCQSNVRGASSSSQYCMLEDVGAGSTSVEPLLAQNNVCVESSSSSAPAPCRPASRDAADLEVLVQHPTSKRTVAIPLIIKVSDFGTGQRLNNVDLPAQDDDPDQHASHLSVFGLVGTPVYMPPEVVRQTPDRRKRLCKRADIWALGIMLFQMLHEGKTPFHLFQGTPGAKEAILAVASKTVNNEVIPKQSAEGRKKLWEVERKRVLADPLRRLSLQPSGDVEVGEVLRSLIEAWVRMEVLFRLGERCLAFSVDDRLDCADLSKLMDRAAEAGWCVWGQEGIDGPTGNDARLAGDARPRTESGVVPDSELSQLVAILEGVMGRGGQNGGAEDVGKEGMIIKNAGREGSAGPVQEGNTGPREGNAEREGNGGGGEATTDTEEMIFSALDMEVARIGDKVGARLFPEVWVARASASVRSSGAKCVVRGPFCGLFDSRFGKVLATTILIVVGLCGGLITTTLILGNRSGTKENDVVVGPTSGPSASGPETPHVSVLPLVGTTTAAAEPSMGQGDGERPLDVPRPAESPPNRSPGFLGIGGSGNAGTGGNGGGAGETTTPAVKPAQPVREAAVNAESNGSGAAGAGGSAEAGGGSEDMKDGDPYNQILLAFSYLVIPARYNWDWFRQVVPLLVWIAETSGSKVKVIAAISDCLKSSQCFWLNALGLNGNHTALSGVVPFPLIPHIRHLAEDNRKEMFLNFRMRAISALFRLAEEADKKQIAAIIDLARDYYKMNVYGFDHNHNPNPMPNNGSKGIEELNVSDQKEPLDAALQLRALQLQDAVAPLVAHATIIRAIWDCLTDASEAIVVRSEAARALVGLAAEGGSKVIAATIMKLRDSPPFPRDVDSSLPGTSLDSVSNALFELFSSSGVRHRRNEFE